MRDVRMFARRLANRSRLEVAGLLARGTGRLPLYWYSDLDNFGDAISGPIVEYLTRRRSQVVHRGFTPKLLAVGSILHEVGPGDVVWGSGAIEDEPIEGREATFLAVRGPLTRELVDGKVPAVYGDPGLILPRLYEPRPSHQRYSVGLVPHLDDRAALRADDLAVLNVDVRTRDWRAVVNQIASCDIVASSSLHGLVTAEAYGIPAVWVPMPGPRGGSFKFRDYYAATDREPISADWTRGLAAVAARAQEPPLFDLAPLVRALVDAASLLP